MFEEDDEITKDEISDKADFLFGKDRKKRIKKKAVEKSQAKKDREDAAKAASEYGKKKEEGEG